MSAVADATRTNGCTNPALKRRAKFMPLLRVEEVASTIRTLLFITFPIHPELVFAFCLHLRQGLVQMAVIDTALQRTFVAVPINKR